MIRGGWDREGPSSHCAEQLKPPPLSLVAIQKSRHCLLPPVTGQDAAILASEHGQRTEGRWTGADARTQEQMLRRLRSKTTGLLGWSSWSLSQSRCREQGRREGQGARSPPCSSTTTTTPRPRRGSSAPTRAVASSSVFCFWHRSPRRQRRLQAETMW